MEEREPATDTPKAGRGWPRAAGLFGVVMAASAFQPSVLVATPFLLLAGTRGVRGLGLVVASIFGTVVLASGDRNGVWFMERAWGLLMGGWFVGVTLVRPEWRLTDRLLAAVGGALAVSVLVLGSRAGAWETVEFVVADGILGGVATSIQALTVLRGGDAVSPALVTALQETARAQVEVFPAMLAVASMAGVAVAWWLYHRLRGEGDQAIGPVRGFRFNDHLVWVMIGGLLMLVLRWGDAVARIGSNAVIFMGALYALRGAAVFMFISGGLSLFGYAMLAVGLVLAAPVVLGVLMMVGIGDTWLDVRARLRGTTV